MKRPSYELISVLSDQVEDIYVGEKYAIGVPLSPFQKERFKAYCIRVNKTQQEMANRAVILIKPKKVPARRKGKYYKKTNILFRENAYVHVMRMADELGVTVGQYASACITEVMKR